MTGNSFADTRIYYSDQPIPNRLTERLTGLLAGLDKLDLILTLPTYPQLSERGLPFARFCLRSRIGTGRFGFVFLADDPQLGRQVAIKVPQPTVLADRELRERFAREATATARLQHFGIVSVFETGEVDRLPYLATTFISGPTLLQWRRQHSQPVKPDAAARLVSAVAKAVHHAHERGVLHCDITPSNVLLRKLNQTGDQPEDLDDYVPVVTDFGLARLLDEDPTLTGTFQVAGTPQYMSPEQARGDRRNLTSQTDVYAIGVLLYELLVGHPPFVETPAQSVIHQVLSATPIPPRASNQAIPQDLEAVCLKCLEKDSSDRYPSTRLLAEDLDRFLVRLPVSARPVNEFVRMARWIHRNVLASSAIVATFVVSAIALAVAMDRWSREAKARLDLQSKTAMEAKATIKAENADKSARTAEFYAVLERSRQRRLIRSPRWVDLNRMELTHLSEDVKQTDLAALRTEAIAVASSIDLGPQRSVGQGVHTYSVAYAPSENLLALGGFGTDDTGMVTLRLLNSQSGLITRELKFPGDRDWEQIANGRRDGCWSIAFHPNGKMIAAGTRAGSLVVWDLDRSDPNPIARWQHASDKDSLPQRRPAADRVSLVTFDAAGMLWSNDDRTGASWNPGQDWQRIQMQPGCLSRGPTGARAGRIFVDQHPVALHPSGRMFLRRVSSQELALFDIDGCPVGRLAQADNDRADDGTITDFAFSPDGRLLATAAEHVGHLKLWDVVGSRLLAARNLGSGSLKIDFSPDGRELAVVLSDQVMIFGLSQSCVDTSPVQVCPIDDSDLTPDGRYLATVAMVPNNSGDMTASLYDLHRPPFEELKYQSQQGQPVGHGRCRIGISPDGQSMVLPSRDHYIELDANGVSRPLQGPLFCRDVRFTADRQMWAIGADQVAHRSVGQEPRISMDDTLSSMAITTTGAVVGRNDGSISWYNTNGMLVRSKQLGTIPITSLACQGDRLIAGTSSGDALILRDNTIAQNLPNVHTDAIWTIAIGPRGIFATGSADRDVRIWSSVGDLICVLPQTRLVRRLFWSDDGRTLTILAEGERALRSWRLNVLQSELASFGLEFNSP